LIRSNVQPLGTLQTRIGIQESNREHENQM